MRLFITALACLITVSGISQYNICDSISVSIVNSTETDITLQTNIPDLAGVLSTEFQFFLFLDGIVIDNQVNSSPTFQNIYTTNTLELCLTTVIDVGGNTPITCDECYILEYILDQGVWNLLSMEVTSVEGGKLENLSVQAYPNPASNNLTIDLGNLTGLNITIKLYDSSSKLVFEKQATSTLMIDVSGYAKGLYTLELATDEQVLRSQVIIE
jgi:hypothetical protein